VRKLLAILWKDVALRFTEPTVLLLAIVMPLGITALIELAFGNLVLGRGIPDTNIPVGIVNQDQGGRWGDFGQIFPAVLSGAEATASPAAPPFELFRVIEIQDVARARRMVDREELTAALWIPPDFSQALENEQATVTIYINDRYVFRGVAFQSLVGLVANVISTGETTVRTTVEGLLPDPRTRAQLESGQLDEAVADLVRIAVTPESNPIKVERVDGVGLSTQVDLVYYLASALAIFFSGYTALVGSASLLQEKDQGTLQRTLSTPTRPAIILAGKALATYLKGLIQMGVLLGGMIVMEWLAGHGPTPGPKINLFGLALLVPAVVAAATGIGVAIAGFAGTYAQAANYGRAVFLLMGLAGGIFFPVSLYPRPLQALSRLTYHFWAMDGALKMALGGSVIGIVPHLLVLVTMGVLFFSVGSWLLRRRIGLF
jgi:ABC-2 type transport system permease protein